MGRNKGRQRNQKLPHHGVASGHSRKDAIVIYATGGTKVFKSISRAKRFMRTGEGA